MIGMLRHIGIKGCLVAGSMLQAHKFIGTPGEFPASAEATINI
jgi:hypothetical protein